MAYDPFTLISGGGFRCTPAWDQQVWEPHDKWYFPSSGEAFYDAGDGEFRLAPGRVWLIPGRRRHVMRCPRRLDLWWLHARVEDRRLAGPLERMIAPRSWPVVAWRSWQPTYTAIERWFAERPFALGCRLQAMLLWSVADVVTDTPPAPEPSPAVAAAVAFLDREAQRTPPLVAVARAARLSPVYLHRRFVAEVGCTPHAYAERRRLAVARDLLRDTDLPVGEIGARCGYADPFYFSRAFRRQAGEGPAAFRRRARGP